MQHTDVHGRGAAMPRRGPCLRPPSVRRSAFRVVVRCQVPPHVAEVRTWIASWRQKQQRNANLHLSPTDLNRAGQAQASDVFQQPAAAAHVLEARAWIAAWRQKQRDIPTTQNVQAPRVWVATWGPSSDSPPQNVQEAHAWVTSWRQRQSGHMAGRRGNAAIVESGHTELDILGMGSHGSEELAVLRAERDVLSKRLDSLQREHLESQINSHKLALELELSLASRTALTEEHELLRGTINKLRSDIDQIEAQESTVTNTQNRIAAENRELQSQLETAMQQLQDARKQLGHAVATPSGSRPSTIDPTSTASSRITRMELDAHQQGRQLNALVQQISALNELAMDQAQHSQALLLRIAQLSSELESAQCAAAGLRSGKAELQRKLAAAQSELQSLAMQNALMRGQEAEVEHARAAAEQTATDLLSRINEAFHVESHVGSHVESHSTLHQPSQHQASPLPAVAKAALVQAGEREAECGMEGTVEGRLEGLRTARQADLQREMEQAVGAGQSGGLQVSVEDCTEEVAALLQWLEERKAVSTLTGHDMARDGAPHASGFVNTQRFWVPANVHDDFVRCWILREAEMQRVEGFAGLQVVSEGDGRMTVRSHWSTVPHWERWSTSRVARRHHLPYGIFQYVPKRGEGFPEDFIPFKDLSTPVDAKY